jgi:2-dehydro-3-deoxy-D-arabinonate dehydratase
MTFKPQIRQVIGVAHTYMVSRAVRKALSGEGHSSHQTNPFSYFKKVEQPEDIVSTGESLVLRKHPETDESVAHWYEPELAIILGPNHTIAGYALGNDLTAKGIEFEAHGEGYDPTYFGKCWKGSCALGAQFVTPDEIGDDRIIEIRLRIEQNGQTIYDHSYSTDSALWSFADIPQMIIVRRAELMKAGELPASKQILLDENGMLPEGTVILTGTGLITPEKYYAIAGDVVTVSSQKLGELRNTVRG